MQIKWLRKALRNLEQVHKYTLEQGSLEAASATIFRIQKATLQLSNYPLMGRPGRVEETRELVISQTSYIVVYRVKRNSIEILRVIHTSRRYPDTDT